MHVKPQSIPGLAWVAFGSCAAGGRLSASKSICGRVSESDSEREPSAAGGRRGPLTTAEASRRPPGWKWLRRETGNPHAIVAVDHGSRRRSIIEVTSEG